MKRLLILFLFCFGAWAQSDCGNCWVSGWSCTVDLGECPNPICSWCTYYITCDLAECSYVTSACDCGNGIPSVSCKPTVKPYHSASGFWNGLRNPIVITAFKKSPDSIVIKNRFWWKKVKV